MTPDLEYEEPAIRPRHPWFAGSTLLLGAIVLTGLIVSVMVRPPSAEPTACTAIESDMARLACYDRSAHRVPPEPARGANAPAG